MSNQEPPTKPNGGASVSTAMLGGSSQKAQVIPFEPPKEAKCSFCGKPESVAVHFWAGKDGASICGGCVVKAKRRCEESS